MIIDDILNEEEKTLLLEKYDIEYIKTIDIHNFHDVYSLFYRYHFPYINDIIIKYLEIFTLNPAHVEEKILLLKVEYGNDYIDIIGQNLSILEFILEE